MAAIGSSFFVVPGRGPARGGPDPELVVWLRGQHDASNQDALCLTLARAIALGGPGLVLDLSEVRAMSPSTVAAIVRAREYLRRRSASLVVRSPSDRVRRLIDACGANDLLGPEAKAAVGRARGANAHWAHVPAPEPYDIHPSQPAAVPRRAPSRSVKDRV
jgi:anti-anti-sigma factor